MVAQNIVASNASRRSIFFSMEMPLVQTVLRLYAITYDVSLPELQRQVEQGGLPDNLYELADIYPQHIIVDQPSLNVDQLSEYLDQYRQRFKHQPDFVVLDYLELLGKAKISGEGYQATEAQITLLKEWVRYENTRAFLVHQANKQEDPWEPVTENSPRNGGYTESDFMMGLWRPHKNPENDIATTRFYEDKAATNLIKNRAYFKTIDRQLIKFHDSGKLTEYHG